jgi:hypothetical protein
MSLCGKSKRIQALQKFRLQRNKKVPARQLTNRNFIQYVFFVLLTLATCAGQAQRTDSAREQTSFSETSPIQHPVPLPPDVLKLLLRRPEVMQNWAEITDAEKKNPAHLFTAAEIDLGTSGDVDLIVEGGSLMSGADNEWFWIVRSAHKNPSSIQNSRISEFATV